MRETNDFSKRRFADFIAVRLAHDESIGTNKTEKDESPIVRLRPAPEDESACALKHRRGGYRW